MLPMFVFISGYVWSYQREILQKKDSFKQLVSKKFKRLYIPSLVFSVAYFLIFHREDYVMVGGGNQLIPLLMHIVSGYGHMWFLPMLFWTFIFTYCLLLIKSRWIRWCIVLCLCVLSLVPIPFGISASFSYIIYFYAGYEILLHYPNKMKTYSIKTNMILWLVFAAVFVALTLLNAEIINWCSSSGLIQKSFGLTVSNFIKKIYGFAGIAALFYSALRYTSSNALNGFTIKIGEYCFGVYLFQQFILQAIYYHSQIPYCIDDRWLPWCAFIVTLFLSLLLSFIMKQFKVGKVLIG